jgi:hypothetical protein
VTSENTHNEVVAMATVHIKTLDATIAELRHELEAQQIGLDLLRKTLEQERLAHHRHVQNLEEIIAARQCTISQEGT